MIAGNEMADLEPLLLKHKVDIAIWVRAASRSIPPQMGANSISFGSPHVRCTPMGRTDTCGDPNEIKKNTHPKNITALFRAQGHIHFAQRSCPMYKVRTQVLNRPI